MAEVCHSWGGPINDPEENYDSENSSLVEEEGPILETIVEDDHPTAKQRYIDQLNSLKESTDNYVLEIVNSYVDRLQYLRSDFEAHYTEREVFVGAKVGTQEPWMQMSGIPPQESYT